MNRFTGQVVVVTGAASGIGAASAARFASEEAAVVLADIDETGIAEKALAIEQAGGRAQAVPCDVGNADSWRELAATVERVHGRVDIVHNNAFTIEYAPAEELSERAWDRQIAVNLSSIYHSVRSLFPLMSGSKCSIVNTSSIHAIVGFRSHPAYAASKGGIVALSQQLAVEYGPRIRVNAVLPGPILTNAWAHSSEEDRIKFAEKTAARRLGMPEEVAAAVAFLASEDASYITGASLVVDGGYLIMGESITD